MKITKTTYMQVIDTIDSKEVTFTLTYTSTTAPTQIDFTGGVDEISYSGTVYASNEVRYSIANGTLPKSFLDAIIAKAKELFTTYETIK